MAGFGDSANPFFTPEGNRQAQVVSFEPNSTKDAYITGAIRPTLVTAEIQYSNNVLVDSLDRIGFDDTPFSFRVDIGANLFRQRQITVQKVTLPLINNVNPMNNEIFFGIQENSWNSGSFRTVLQPGIYDPSALCNELAARINHELDLHAIAFPLQVAGDVICNFESITQQFVITTEIPSTRIVFWDDCSFITRGDLLHGFPGKPRVAPVVAYNYIRSGVASMLYTRTVTIHSDRLTTTAFAKSRTSNKETPNNIIAIVDVSSLYNPQNFDVGVPFSGRYKTVDTTEAPNITILNSEKNLASIIDFTVRDEYNSILDLAMDTPFVPPVTNFTTPSAPLIGKSDIGFSMWLQVYF